MGSGNVSYATLSSDDISDCTNRFKAFFARFLEIAMDEVKSYDVSNDVLSYYSHALQYNLQGGKMMRGILVVITARSLMGVAMSETFWIQSLILGWCVELLQTAFLVADDIMDQSTTRRSNVCWYLIPTIGTKNAINDTMFFNVLIYRILSKNFTNSDKLSQIFNVFNEISMTTILGQHMDTYDFPCDTLFEGAAVATSLYHRICKNKTSYYTFFLPIKLGMLMSGIEISNLNYSKVESISILLGHLFQTQDDFLDCYGNPDHSGKEGTDIQARKCSWLLATALHVATEEQIKQIRFNIGKDNPQNVQKVKNIYNDLNMPQLFQIYVQELKIDIESNISNIEDHGESRLLPHIHW